MSSSGSKARYELKEEVASERGDADGEGLAGSGTCMHVDTPSKHQPSVFFIQNLAGKSVSIPFNPEMTVGELQKQNEFDHGLMRRRGTWDAGVAPREGEKIPAERQCLVFEGRKLDANSRLADCGVSSNSKLYLIELQPRGIRSSRPNDNGCTIPQTEFRSITLRQLKEMAIEMMFRCHKDTWTSTNPAQKGKRLLPEEVTLYDLTHYFIKPVTKERQCSYVELIADAPRECMWFCSHWWGAPVLHFIACLEQHAMDRYLPHAADKVTYWICAYSNNQHNIQEEVHHSSPTDSSFYRAMQLSKGTVSILDADRVCYSRIWCGFEVSVAIRDIAEQRTEKYLYDIYSVSRQELQPVGITDGYTAMDVDRQRRHKEIHNEEREILRFQMERQEMFPFTPEVLDVCIEKGEASVEEDKWKILNFVSGLRNGNTLQVPPKTHKSYDEVNALLRGRFAIATYRIALDNNFQMEKYREGLTQYPGLIHLEMSFLGCTAFQNEAKNFMLSLPVSLLSLDLDYSEIYFDTSDDFIIGLNRLNRLESFALKLPDCDATTSVATIFSELYSLAPTLQNLSLNFKGCFSLDSSEHSFKTTLPTLINLKFLKLSFVRRKLALILQPLTELDNLQTLDLSFEEDLPKGDYFCSTFSAMTGLKNLYLEFGQTWSLTSINGLLEEITRTNGLEVLSVKGLYDGYVITKCPRLQGLESGNSH
ncbi:expressed unknown protein [Seminavis robusta]|uniref:Ubiquitin-like domain-containing protein n=1 Tax=Seminavis robusta TaxID=568900 RepID=A0A9N8E4J2_9STRA|nr:expressed unknown protein [Seminavis robusta]|eukprot:Sro514_g158040.1 n/a (706) ;mRNA; r:24475-26592